ncbi:hypothetical protein M9Y10_019080 [Tritrichomonas musculus]|uniref:F5/8 type C domain-containing protein n=1 Tax=Tritrichomonas musculus TaxID=1915356 RepID=A0ABR2HKD4_9EUKA
MEGEISIKANAEIPTTHFFAYKEKQYPFNFDLFKIFSQYFNSSSPKEEKIDLFDENLNISENSIPDFINFCQARTITLTKENAPTLHKLSQKFKVPSLLTQTKEFISAHQKEVVIEILLMYQNDNIFNLEEYEEIISQDLIKYVNDIRLLNLPVPMLHRIITKYLLNYQNHSNNSEQPSELIEFLFKCLDHFGREASVLFDKIDSFGSNGDLIKRLLDGYSEIFDFSFVNTGNLKTVYQLEKEIIAREKEMKKQNSESKQELMSISKQFGEQMELVRNQLQDELTDRKELFAQIPKMVAQELEVMKKQHQEEMKKKDEMIENMIKQFEAVQANYREELRRQNEDFNEKIKKINDQLENLMCPKITQLYTGNHIGLVSLLGDAVTLSSVKNDSSSIMVSNMRKYDDTFFSNNYGADAKSESDSIFIFDFGSYKRIDIHSYFIRTSRYDTNGRHPKAWRIEGSNDCQSWTKLDSRSNDGSLNGKYKECNFVCQFASYGNASNLFRYIRYVQEDSWNSDTYVVNFTYFELFGSVVTI